MRDAADPAKAGNKDAIIQKTDPKAMAIQRIGRPWNERAPFQVIPTAVNSNTVDVPEGSPGAIVSPNRQSAPEAPPIK